MLLMIKSLLKELLKNRIFLTLMLLMTAFTSFMFFFIRFSIDANMSALSALEALTQNQINYKNALLSNTGLALSWLFAFTGVTALVYVMFYFRFYSSAKKQLGCLKALGFNSFSLQLFFTAFAAAFAAVGLLIGMLAGYFGSSIHLSANAHTYNVDGLIKGINAWGALIGLGVPAAAFALTVFICGFSLYIKDDCRLIYGIKRAAPRTALSAAADFCVRRLPIKNKAPLRIALNKPLTIALLTVASTVFTVMLVLGWSLTQSSEALFISQTDGHYYEYESSFDVIQTDFAGQNAVRYLALDVNIIAEQKVIEDWKLFGMDYDASVYGLKDAGGNALGIPADGYCVIPTAMAEIYSVAEGGVLSFESAFGMIRLTVSGIASNAKTRTVIAPRTYLAAVLGMAEDSYNGVLSMENVCPGADKVIGPEERADALEREKVSGNISALLNQSIGLVSGILLIFLALFIAFQDNVKDMLILDNLGYSGKEIKKLLIKIFLPILITGFIIMCFPSVLIAQSVQFSLSMQMGDYMPFSTNALVLLAGLAILTAVYLLVQLIFGLGIKRLTKKKGILEYINTL